MDPVPLETAQPEAGAAAGGAAGGTAATAGPVPAGPVPAGQAPGAAKAAKRRAGVPVWRTGKPDAFLAAAVDTARTAIEGITAASDVGQHLAAKSEGDRLVTHLFECRLPGYAGWQWFAVLTRNSRSKVVTVNELGLLPSEESILAPEWVPWAERVRPEDEQEQESEPGEDPAHAPEAGTPDAGAQQAGVRADEAEAPETVAIEPATTEPATAQPATAQSATARPADGDAGALHPEALDALALDVVSRDDQALLDEAGHVPEEPSDHDAGTD
ncbi:DUF3027 domain-containing protein [Pseudarthrobacter sp. R1]|nr:DUF3027 domain-containing protein [Pseudarthrobacter sp. R1]MCQ6268939.1 DUF3027 domain-containing protein [Pseudarthrobacter sp. R1]